MKSIWLLFTLSIILNSSSYSQEDSLKIFRSGKIYTQQEVDTLISKFNNKEIPVSKIEELRKILDTNNKLQGGNFYYMINTYLAFSKNAYDSVVKYADSAERSYNQSKLRPFDEQFLLRTHYLRASALNDLGRYKESIEYNVKALDLHKKYPYKWVSYIKANLAENQLSYGNNKIALRYYLENSQDSIFMSLPRPAVSTYTRIGNIYSDLGILDSASVYLNKALKKSYDTNHLKNLDAIFVNLGDIEDELGNKKQAVDYYKKAIEAFNRDSYKSEIAAHYTQYYQSYIDLSENRNVIAIENLEGLNQFYNNPVTIDKDEKDLKILIYKTLGEAYVKTNNLEALLKVSSDSYEFLEEFHQHQLEENLNEVEIKYQTKEKDLSIANLEATNLQKEQIVQQQRLINWILGGLVLTIVGLGYLFFKQRKQKEKYKTANLEQRLLRSQLNPHFLFNALNTASALAQQKSDDTVNYISRLGNLLRSTLENSREEFIPLSEEIATLNSYLELQSDFSKKFTFDITVSNNLDVEEILIPPMFIQPFLENAIEHGFDGRQEDNVSVVINSIDSEKRVQVTVENNGKAYSKASTVLKPLGYKSLSGKILKERLELYSNEYKIKSHFTINDLIKGVSGTKVQLYLPLIKDN